MNNNFKIISAIIFQLGWFICILTNSAISLLFTLLFIVGHFCGIYFLTKTLSLKIEMAWLILCLALGFICETLFFNSKILFQTDAATLGSLQLPPIWLLCLWAMFAIAMRTSLSFIFNKPLLTCLLALIVSPANYYAGASLNAQVDIGQPVFLSLSLLGLIWAFAMACLIAVHHLYLKDV